MKLFGKFKGPPMYLDIRKRRWLLCLDGINGSQSISRMRTIHHLYNYQQKVNSTSNSDEVPRKSDLLRYLKTTSHRKGNANSRSNHRNTFLIDIFKWKYLYVLWKFLSKLQAAQLANEVALHIERFVSFFG